MNWSQLKIMFTTLSMKLHKTYHQHTPLNLKYIQTWKFYKNKTLLVISFLFISFQFGGRGGAAMLHIALYHSDAIGVKRVGVRMVSSMTRWACPHNVPETFVFTPTHRGVSFDVHASFVSVAWKSKFMNINLKDMLWRIYAC